MKLKLATYNIQYGVGQDGEYDLARAIDAVCNQDIVCLQEVTTHWPRCQHDDQPALIAAKLNYYSAFQAAFELDCSTVSVAGKVTNVRRGFGNMVLSRWPILYSRPHALPRPQIEIPNRFYPSVDLPRIALETVIQIDEKALRVICVHLSHLPGEQQRAQADALVALCSSTPAEASLWEMDDQLNDWSAGQSAPPVPQSTIVLGDFNVEPDNEIYHRLTREHDAAPVTLVDAWSACPTPQSSPESCVEADGRLSRLDYMFVSTDLAANIQSAKVDQTIQASDHFPLYFEMMF